MYAVKGVKLCWFLTAHGQHCKSVELDKSNSNYLVYLFERNEEFEKIMDLWHSNQAM